MVSNAPASVMHNEQTIVSQPQEVRELLARNLMERRYLQKLLSALEYRALANRSTLSTGIETRGRR